LDVDKDSVQILKDFLSVTNALPNDCHFKLIKWLPERQDQLIKDMFIVATNKPLVRVREERIYFPTIRFFFSVDMQLTYSWHNLSDRLALEENGIRFPDQV
jgi:hypothetical protein